MGVTVDDEVDALDVGEDVLGAVGLRLGVGAQVADGDDVVALLLLEGLDLSLGALDQLLALMEGEALHVVGVGLGHGLGGIQTEHAHLANLGVEGGAVTEQGLVVLGLDNVGSQDGELGQLQVGHEGLHLVVKLMVAGGGHVVAGGVHELDSAGALVQAHQSGALGEVTGGDQQHAGTGGLKGLLQSGHTGSADGLALHSHIMAVGVVGVDDDQLALHIGGDGVGHHFGLYSVGFLGHGGGRQGEDHHQREHQGQELLALHGESPYLYRFFGTVVLLLTNIIVTKG